MDGITVEVPLVVQMSAALATEYAAEYDLPQTARAVSERVREWALGDVRRGPLGEFAEVKLK